MQSNEWYACHSSPDKETPSLVPTKGPVSADKDKDQVIEQIMINIAITHNNSNPII